MFNINTPDSRAVNAVHVGWLFERHSISKQGHNGGPLFYTCLTYFNHCFCCGLLPDEFRRFVSLHFCPPICALEHVFSITSTRHPNHTSFFFLFFSFISSLLFFLPLPLLAVHHNASRVQVNFFPLFYCFNQISFGTLLTISNTKSRKLQFSFLFV